MSRFMLGGWPSDNEYEVMVVLADGNPEVVATYGDLDKAFERVDEERKLLRSQHYTQFFVGVIDANDPERGWLSADDESETWTDADSPAPVYVPPPAQTDTDDKPF